MKTLKSFGCSFVYGSDLSDCTNHSYSRWAWPALIAKQLKFKYRCLAKPGQGNFKIYCDILANSDTNKDSVFLINWTWIDRYDYIDREENWQTLRPANENHLQRFYYQNLHSQMVDIIQDATYIVAAAKHLQGLQIPYIMTYMDNLLFEPVNSACQNLKYVESLQHKLRNILVDFGDTNFLDWSYKNNFAVSERWHPLEEAHQGAANYWLPIIQNLLTQK
jgi:hypothetical protein